MRDNSKIPHKTHTRQAQPYRKSYEVVQTNKIINKYLNKYLKIQSNLVD